MQENKEKRIRLFFVFSSILFALIILSNLYVFINYPSNYILIILLAILGLVSLYGVIHSYMMLDAMKKERREEQYESIFKSEKASYLMLKNYFEKIDEKIDVLQESSKVPTDEIINAQKALIKVVINRSKENAEALLNANEQVMEKLYELEERLDGVSKEILDEQREIGTNNISQMLLKQQDLVMSLKDMELRLNGAILSSQKVVAQTPVMAAPVMTPSSVQITESVTDSAPVVEEVPVMEEEIPEVEEIPVMEEEIPEVEETPVMEEGIPVAEETSVVEEEIPVVEETPVMEEEIPMVEETPVMEEEIPVVEETLVMEEEIPVVEEIPMVEEEISVVEETPVVDEAEVPPMPDLSDPNKSLSADEIAALFANMAGEDANPMEPEPEPEPVEEAKPEMPDLSDPNKVMSPDEIAALIANL